MKFEALQSNIYQMILFETACDMNNKYDTKGFTTLYENIDRDKYMAKVTPKLKKLDNCGKYTFTMKDEIRDMVPMSPSDHQLYKLNPIQRKQSIEDKKNFL